MTCLSGDTPLWTCQRGADSAPVEKLILSVREIGLEVLPNSRTSRSPRGWSVRTTTEMLRIATDYVVLQVADDPPTPNCDALTAGLR